MNQRRASYIVAIILGMVVVAWMMLKARWVDNVKKRYKRRRSPGIEWECDDMKVPQWVIELPDAPPHAQYVGEALAYDLSLRLKRTIYWISSSSDTHDNTGTLYWLWHDTENDTIRGSSRGPPATGGESQIRRQWIFSTLPNLASKTGK